MIKHNIINKFTVLAVLYAVFVHCVSIVACNSFDGCRRGGTACQNHQKYIAQKREATVVRTILACCVSKVVYYHCDGCCHDCAACQKQKRSSKQKRDAAVMPQFGEDNFKNSFQSIHNKGKTNKETKKGKKNNKKEKYLALNNAKEAFDEMLLI